MKHAIAANYLGILDKCLKQQGIDSFLQEIAIEPLRIQDPQAYLSLEEFSFILKTAYQYKQLPHLGLLFGEELSIVNHGFLGFATMTSPTFGTALQTLLNYLATRTAIITGQLKKNSMSNQSYVELKLLTTDSLNNQFLTEMVIAHLAKIRTFLINVTIPFHRIEIVYSEPSHSSYYLPFANKIKFNSLETRIFFLDSELNAPLKFADDTSYQQAKCQLQRLTEQLLTKDDILSRIKKILYTQDLYQLNMERVAQQLCLTPRTLRRHLNPYKLTYQEILDTVRQEKAQELLINTQLSITEISFLLGFHELSNFTKAFKRWSDYTPSDYRELFTIKK